MTREITAKEVRALPIGSRVTVHSHDRYGYPTHLKQSRYCLRQARPARANPADSSAALPPTRFAWAAVRMMCEVVARREGKGVELRYNTFGGFERMPIRAHAGRVFTVEVSEDG